MLYSRSRRAVAAFAAILAFAPLSACGGTASAAEQRDESVQIEPVTVVIQMSGLLLLVPPKQPEGATHVLMPKLPSNMSQHIAYLGFRQDSTHICKEYRASTNICYVSLDDWAVGPIGGAGGSVPVIPRSVVNLTRGSGNVTVDTTKPQVRDRIRSQLTLLSGSATDSCGLATWTFDPYGSPPPEKLPLINVLEWQIPDLQSETLELVLHSRHGPAVERRVTLHANEAREVELLVLHVTEKEGAPFTGPERQLGARSATRVVAPAFSTGGGQGAAPAAATHPAHERPSQLVRQHFQAFYSLLDADSARRRMPTRPAKIRDMCPITVLDLAEFDDDGERGIRTYSCVMASAEGA